jgi:hypothetical protein
MISPLHQQALHLGASKPWLNPSNEGQGRFSVYCGKPMRALARLIYGLSCTTLIPTAGAFYHMGKAIDCTIMSKSQTELKTRSWQHLAAASRDAYMAGKMAAFISLQALNFTYLAQNSGLIGVALTVLAGKTALTPFQFMLDPTIF